MIRMDAAREVMCVLRDPTAMAAGLMDGGCLFSLRGTRGRIPGRCFRARDLEGKGASGFRGFLDRKREVLV